MTFRQLVYRNIIRNPRAYLSYFLSSVFSVFIFFTTALLYFHPSFRDEFLEGNTRLTMISVYLPSSSLFGFSLIIIATLALLFLGSMFRMFLRERRHDFSLYLILGMTKQKLKLMIAWENSIICIGSIMTGISLGMVFGKLMLLISQNVLSLDYSLGLYIPVKAIVLVTVIYLAIFSFITFFTISSIQNKQANMNLSVSGKQTKEPQVNQYVTAFGVLILGFAYLAMVIFGLLIQWQITLYSTILDTQLIAVVAAIAVVLLLAGMYLFFNQSIVHFVKLARERRHVLKGDQLLILSSLTYRLKHNGTFHFIVATSSTMALILITTTLFLAKIELFANDQDNSLAYTYRAYDVRTPEDVVYHQTNIDYITKTIKEAGYQIRVSEPQDNLFLLLQSHQAIPDFYKDKKYLSAETELLSGDNKFLDIISLSEYNEMAEFNSLPKLYLKSPYEVVLLKNTPNMPNRLYSGDVEYEGEKQRKLQRVRFRFYQGTYQAGRVLMNISVVSDAFFKTIQEESEKARPRIERASQAYLLENKDEIANYQDIMDSTFIDFPFHVIHFREWAEAPQVDFKIRHYLKERQEMVNEQIVKEGDDYDPNDDQYTFFEYSSSYQTLSQQEEETGVTLFVSVLVGTVFFIFSACLTYFRLFGQLEQDSRYHRTLNLIGVPKKNRDKLLSVELLVLFFLPIIVALFNYLLFGILAQRIIDFSIWGIFLKVATIFIVIQFISYLIARKHYLKEIDYRLEHQKNY